MNNQVKSAVPKEAVQLGEPDAGLKSAALIRELTGFNGHASLYRLNPPISAMVWSDEEEAALHEYVVASATVVPYIGGTETYLFPASEDGEIVDWTELPGSTKGTLQHSVALANAGYSIVDSEASA